MPPQHPETIHHSPLKSASSEDCSFGRNHPVDVPSRSSAASTPTRDDQAAEEWLSRSNLSPRPPLTDSMQQCAAPDSPHSRTSSSRDASSSGSGASITIPVRTSLRERLQARMKELGKPEPLHAEAMGRLLTKGLTQMSPPPPPPPPHPTPTSLVGRKSPRELDTYLCETTEYEPIPSSKMDPPPPPPPRVSARSRSKSNVGGVFRQTKDSSKKKQKVSSTTSDAVARIMEVLHENQQHKAADNTAHASLLRLSRQVKYGKKVEASPKRDNSIKLHIYDLLTTETYMQLGWGCEFPIGQCFQSMNDGLHALGTGAYHCGIEINGIEYAYGANNSEGTTGVFSCLPKHSPGFEYRTTLDFGSRPLMKRAWVRVSEKEKGQSVYREVVNYVDGREVVKEMAKEYLGPDYDLLRRNCCTFARDASLRLGIEQDEIPSWLMNLADAGALTQDVAAMTLKPITSMLSGIEDDDDSIIDTSRVEEEDGSENGFEVIAKPCKKKKGRSLHEMEIIKVVDALEMENMERVGAETYGGRGKRGQQVDMRRTSSWAY